MTLLVERFVLVLGAGLVVAAVAIEAGGGGGLAGMVSAGLSALCLGLVLYFLSRGVMTLVEPRGGEVEGRGRLDLLRLDLVQLRCSLESVRLDGRIQRIGVEEREELEAPLLARVEAVEERIARIEREGDEDMRDEEILELARARMAPPKASVPPEASAPSEESAEESAEEGGEA